MEDSSLKKLNLGCGRDIKDGWINLDFVAGAKIDVVADLDKCDSVPLPFDNDTIDEFYGSHLIEHLKNPLPFMEEIYRISKPNAKAIFKVPYGSSDDAFEDPTHVRQYFINSFLYFSQPIYWRADYGYRGDWKSEKVILKVNLDNHKTNDSKIIWQNISNYRNMVNEMEVHLISVKPIRNQSPELIDRPEIYINNLKISI